MGFEAKIIAHSVGPHGQELVTTQFKYPRFIHAEFMTHREFSRNASSSRAIPVAKMIEQVRNDPAMPIHWGANQPGMQASQELDDDIARLCETHWKQCAEYAADQAEYMSKLGLHKQATNRVLEPFQWMHVIATTARTNNFMGLRAHKDAQPEIKHLAKIWGEALAQSVPDQLGLHSWHLPYIQPDDYARAEQHLLIGRITRDMPSQAQITNVLIAMSAARCARVSYLTHEGKIPSVTDDLNLYERLVGSKPLHASPTEHQATPDRKIWNSCQNTELWVNPKLHGNLPGWQQFRKMLPGEYIS